MHGVCNCSGSTSPASSCLSTFVLCRYAWCDEQKNDSYPMHPSMVNIFKRLLWDAATQLLQPYQLFYLIQKFGLFKKKLSGIICMQNYTRACSIQLEQGALCNWESVYGNCKIRLKAQEIKWLWNWLFKFKFNRNGLH